MVKHARPTFKAPLYLTWEVTLQCNARCLQCYSDSGLSRHHSSELSTNEALDIIDQLADAGLIILAFSGGEPLTRRDIFTLIERAVEGGLLVNIATNGACVTEYMAKRLKDTGVRSVTVSLDGVSATVHDNIRQCPGLFVRTIKAIERLVEQNLRVGVSFTPMRINHHEGPDVVRLAYNLGASAVNMSEYVPAGRGTHDLALSPHTLRDVVSQWIDMRSEYTGRIEVLWHDCRVSLLVPPKERDLYTGCGAGTTVARIKVDGTLTPCVFLNNPAGNLKNTTFREIWDNSPLLRTIRNRDEIRSGNCGGCAHKYVCGGCRAVSMAQYGELMKGDPSCWVIPDAEPERIG